MAAPVFKEIAQKIYTSTPVESEITPKDFEFDVVENNYKQYNKIINKENNLVPNVKGMSAMDALSLLENFGLKVKLSGVGKVKKQSIRKGTRIVKGKTIVLTLS